MINGVTGFQNNNRANKRNKTPFGTTIKSSYISPKVLPEATQLEPVAENSHLIELFRRFRNGEFKISSDNKAFKSENTGETIKRGMLAGHVRSIVLASPDEKTKTTSINVATSPKSRDIINCIFEAFSKNPDKK